MNVDQFAPYEELARQFRHFYPTEGDGAHDCSHLERVWRNTKTIHAEEGGDLEILAAAVLLHDCVQVPKNSPLRESASRLAAAEARTALEALQWDESRIQIVVEAIESHSFSAGITPSTLEGEILQDADRLDAIGFTGIARCFYTAGRMGSSLYHSSDPVGKDRSLNDEKFALDHFLLKLLTLADGFKSPTGRRLAQERHRTLQGFFDGMLEEVG